MSMQACSAIAMMCGSQQVRKLHDITGSYRKLHAWELVECNGDVMWLTTEQLRAVTTYTTDDVVYM